MISTSRRLAGRSSFSLALLAAIAIAGCSKAPAAAALKTADDAVAAARRDGEKFAPEQLKALTDAASAAHAQFERGDYAAANSAAEAVVADGQDVVKTAAAKKEATAKAWGELQARVPEAAEAVRAKVAELSGMKRLPKGISAAQLEDAKTGLAALDQDWTEASAAAKSGDLLAALEKGRAASARAQQLKDALSLGAASEPAPGPRPPAGK